MSTESAKNHSNVNHFLPLRHSPFVAHTKISLGVFCLFFLIPRAALAIYKWLSRGTKWQRTTRKSEISSSDFFTVVGRFLLCKSSADGVAHSSSFASLQLLLNSPLNLRSMSKSHSVIRFNFQSMPNGALFVLHDDGLCGKLHINNDSFDKIWTTSCAWLMNFPHVLTCEFLSGRRNPLRQSLTSRNSITSDVLRRNPNWRR